MEYMELSFDFKYESVVDDGLLLVSQIRRHISNFNTDRIGIALERDKQSVVLNACQHLLIVSGELLPLHYFVFTELAKTNGLKMDSRFDPYLYYGRGFIYLYSSSTGNKS
jgi:hypothetical protein